MAYSYIETTVSALESAKRTVSSVDYYDISYTNLDYTPLFSTTQVEADKYVSDVGDTLQVTLGVNVLDRSSNTDLWIVDHSNNRVTINTGDSAWSSLNPQSTDLVRLTRVSKKDAPYVDYANAAVLTEQDLDAQAKQSLHIVQESIDTANDSMPLATDGKWDANSKVIKNIATPSAGNDAVNKTYADTVNDSVGAHRDDALDHRDTAADYATRTAGVVRLFEGATNNSSDSSPADQTGVYSSKEYAQGSQASTGGSAKNWATQVGADVTGASAGDKSAKSWAIETGGTAPSAGSAKEWAQETSSAVDTAYSAKEYAQGSQAGTGGSAKNWATQTGADVTGASSGDMSSKEWAVGTLGRGVANEGSAKDWATYTSGTVDNSGYSALYHANAAENSAIAAKNSAAAVANALDSFDDRYLGTMADNATATDADTTGTWAKNSSVITVASKSNIIVGQEVTGSGIPTDANVISISSSSNEVTISENMAAAGSNVDLDFRGQGVYGAFNSSKDGPGTDNDGNTLVTGALYFNTTDNGMKVYDGVNWIAASASGSTSLLIYKYVASGSQTTFSGNDANGASLSYTTNNIIVFLNGVKLDASDYTATSGTSIVLGSGATALDELVVVVFKSFTTADMVPASTGGTFSGNVTHSGTLTANGTINANSTIDMQGTELILDADADTSLHASTDDQIDIKVGGTDVGNFNSDTLNLVKDGSPKLTVEDTGETAWSSSWLTSPEIVLKHSTDNASADGVLGTIQFKGTTKTDIGGTNTVGGADIVSVQGRSFGGGHQYASSVKGGLRVYGMQGDGTSTTLLELQGKDIKIQSGGGIDFSVNSTENSQSASNVGKVLYDFEQGEYSPALNGVGGGLSGLDATRKGYYTRIGDIVHVTIYINNNQMTQGPSGNAYISLPFTVKDSNFSSAGTIGYANNFTKTPQRINAGQGSDKLYIYKYSSSSIADNSGFTNLDASEINSNSEFYAQVTYRAA